MKRIIATLLLIFISILHLNNLFAAINSKLPNNEELPSLKIGENIKDTINTPTDTLKIVEIQDTIINENDSFSIDNFKVYLKQINAPHAHIIYSIAKHESGFRSELFVYNNNLFGMRRPNVRPNKSIQEGQRWAKFEHWTHSVDDFILYMQYTGVSNSSEKQFLNHIDRNYAMRSGYQNTLKKYFQEYID